MRDAPAAVLAGDANHEGQASLDEPTAGVLVALAVAAGELALRLGVEGLDVVGERRDSGRVR